jgi:hypothetical protein
MWQLIVSFFKWVFNVKSKEINAAPQQNIAITQASDFDTATWTQEMHGIFTETTAELSKPPVSDKELNVIVNRILSVKIPELYQKCLKNKEQSIILIPHYFNNNIKIVELAYPIIKEHLNSLGIETSMRTPNAIWIYVDEITSYLTRWDSEKNKEVALENLHQGGIYR